MMFQGAIGEKNSAVLMSIGMFISGFAITFSTGWLLTLVVSSIIPFIFITGLLYVWAIKESDKKTSEYYMQAGGFV